MIQIVYHNSCACKHYLYILIFYSNQSLTFFLVCVELIIICRTAPNQISIYIRQLSRILAHSLCFKKFFECSVAFLGDIPVQPYKDRHYYYILSFLFSAYFGSPGGGLNLLTHHHQHRFVFLVFYVRWAEDDVKWETSTQDKELCYLNEIYDSLWQRSALFHLDLASVWEPLFLKNKNDLVELSSTFLFYHLTLISIQCFSSLLMLIMN